MQRAFGVASDVFIPRLLLAGPGKLCKYLSIPVQQLSGLMKVPQLQPLGPAGEGMGRGRLGHKVGENVILPASWLCDLARLFDLSEPQRGLMLNRMA